LNNPLRYGITVDDLHIFTDFVSVTFRKTVLTVTKEKSSEKILSFLKETPTLTATDIALKIGISSRAVEKQLSKLKNTGKLKRIGPAKGGKWEVDL